MDDNPFKNALLDAFRAGRCPDCGRPIARFLAGPRGGMNQNVCCPACWSAFNVGLWHGQHVSAQRIANEFWRGTPGFKERGHA